MTNLSKERYQLAKVLFAQAVDLPREARESFLLDACGSDKELLYEVETLLGHDSSEDADDFGVLSSQMA